MTEHATVVPGRGPRLIGLGLAVLAFAHSVVIGLWALPNPVRDAVGNDRLAAYVLPYFEQSWRVFAPIPRRVDENLSIRAKVVDPLTGVERVTAWFAVTADDDRKVGWGFNRVRMNRASHVIAGDLNASFATFNLAQQELVQDGFADPRSSVLESALLSPQIGPEPADADAVRAFLQGDEMAVRFVSMYASALWGQTVVQVQYRIGRRPVVDYESRQTADDVGFDLNTFRWRPVIPSGREAQEGFDDWVHR